MMMPQFLASGEVLDLRGGTLISKNLLRNIWSDEKVALSRLRP